MIYSNIIVIRKFSAFNAIKVHFITLIFAGFLNNFIEFYVFTIFYQFISFYITYLTF